MLSAQKNRLFVMVLLSAQKSHLIAIVRLSAHIIYFGWEIKKKLSITLLSGGLLQPDLRLDILQWISPGNKSRP